MRIFSFFYLFFLGGGGEGMAGVRKRDADRNIFRNESISDFVYEQQISERESKKA